MCGFDPFYWYEQELDRQYIAEQHGYNSYEEYIADIKDDIGNMQYDEMKGARL